MPTTKKPPKETIRSWRVSLLRQRAHYLGDVQATDLDNEQRKRLVVKERD
jgi:hypothetical protein